MLAFQLRWEHSLAFGVWCAGASKGKAVRTGSIQPPVDGLNWHIGTCGPLPLLGNRIAGGGWRRSERVGMESCGLIYRAGSALCPVRTGIYAPQQHDYRRCTHNELLGTGLQRKHSCKWSGNNGLVWWMVGGSNPRPPHCERGALPAELTTHLFATESNYPR
jgi:hypothetical protein